MYIKNLLHKEKTSKDIKKFINLTLIIEKIDLRPLEKITRCGDEKKIKLFCMKYSCQMLYFSRIIIKCGEKEESVVVLGNRSTG